MRRPVGITVPYREVGYKEPTMREIVQKLKALEARIERLEKQKEKK